MCCVCFKKRKPNIKEIMGLIKVYREKQDAKPSPDAEITTEQPEAKLKLITEIPFSNTMCKIPQEGMCHPQSS